MSAPATVTGLLGGLDALLPELTDLYVDLHAHPELSFQETRTAALVASRLADRGFEVHTGVGGTGVVGVLTRGEGPVVMLMVSSPEYLEAHADREAGLERTIVVVCSAAPSIGAAAS